MEEGQLHLNQVSIPSFDWNVHSNIDDSVLLIANGKVKSLNFQWSVNLCSVQAKL